MKVLFDSNVWLSGLIARGLCADLLRLALQRQGHGQGHGQGHFELLVSAGIRNEVLRILHDKFKATAAGLDAARAAMAAACEVADGTWQPPADFPDPDDAPIIAAALAARADWFVTGDKALLALGTVQGLAIIAPRDAYLRLRGLV